MISKINLIPVFVSLGNPNASIPTPQPVRPRPMFGAFGAAVGANSVVFVSQVWSKLYFHTQGFLEMKEKKK